MANRMRLELYQEYPLAGEEELATKLADYIKSVMVKRDDLTGATYRDVHAKTVAALKAELIVDGDVPPELRHGIFREPRRYPVWVRYSSTFPRPRKGAERDIRGMALKLMDVPGEKLLPEERHAPTQDFVYLSTASFLTRNTREFYDFTVAFNSGLAPLCWFGLIHPTTALNLLRSQKRVPNPMAPQYFSATPYRLGELAVKHSLKPRFNGNGHLPSPPGNDAWRDVIDRQLAHQEVTYDFLVQVQRDPYRQPIENALVPWSEALSPFHKVATLRIPQQKVDTPERNQAGEGLSLNVWHSLPEHRPLGNVNRARKIVYTEICKFRRERNIAPMAEPAAGPDFLET